MEREAETDENLVLVSLAGLWAIKVTCPPSSSWVLPSFFGGLYHKHTPECEILCNWTPPCLLLLCWANDFLAGVMLSKVVFPMEPKRKVAPKDLLSLWSLGWCFNSLWHHGLCQTPDNPLLMPHTKPFLGTEWKRSYKCLKGCSTCLLFRYANLFMGRKWSCCTQN